jgi:hypothetical protein
MSDEKNFLAGFYACAKPDMAIFQTTTRYGFSEGSYTIWKNERRAKRDEMERDAEVS